MQDMQPYQEFIHSDAWMRVSRVPYSLPVGLGVDAQDDPIVEDFARMGSLAIVGSDSYDQGCVLGQIMGGWLYWKTPKEVQLVLVDGYDGNNLVLGAFKNYPHVVKYLSGHSGSSLSPTTDFDREVDAVVRSLDQELVMRRNLMRLSGCKTFAEYASKYQTPRRVYIFADLPEERSYLRVHLRKLFATNMSDAGIHVIMSAMNPPKACTEVYRPYLDDSEPGVSVGCISFHCIDKSTSNHQFGGPEAAQPGHMFYRCPEGIVAVVSGLEDPGYEMSCRLKAKWPPNKPQVKPVQQPKSIAPKLVVQQRSPLPRSTVRHTEKLTRTVNRPAQTAPVPDRQRVLDLLCQNCASATAEARSVFWAVLLIMTSLAVAGYCYFAWYVWIPIALLIFPLASAIGKNVLIRHRMDVTALGAPTTDNRVWFLFDEARRRRTQYKVSWSDRVGSGDYADVTRETHGQIEQFVQPSPTCLTTASNAPSYDLGSGTLVLLRDAAFYVGGFYPTMCVLPYSGFWVQQKDACVRRSSNPQDGSGVSVSWEHERVNGGPDRRFKSNTATYMCSYELISYSAKSANGKHDIQGGILLSQN